MRGPIGAAVLSAKRLQWNVNHPYLWVNDRGDELSLLEARPRLVEWHVRQSWERLISRRVARKLQAQGFDAQDTVGFAVVRQVLNSNAGSQLTTLQKGALRAVACDAVWPKDRLIAAGYDVDPVCELCRAQPDSMFHRLWECQNEAAKLARKEIAPQRLIDEALALGPTSAVFCRGLCQDLSLAVPAPLSAGGIVYTANGIRIEDPALWTLSGDIFYDGSCLQRGTSGLSRGTWAAVQLGPDNRVSVCVSGPVWSSLPQTAQAAEHCARAGAVQILNGPSRLFGDSRNIVAHAKRRPAEACRHSWLHAAASKVAFLSPGGAHVMEDVWVKAHRDPATQSDAWDRYIAIGNNHADAAAVAAQARLGNEGTDEWRALEGARQKMSSYAAQSAS